MDDKARQCEADYYDPDTIPGNKAWTRHQEAIMARIEADEAWYAERYATRQAEPRATA